MISNPGIFPPRSCGFRGEVVYGFTRGESRLEASGDGAINAGKEMRVGF
jgi:hypothetical protein